MRSFGFAGSLFENYLCYRKQTVERAAYDDLPAYSGVSQGSILGPLMFILNVNDRFGYADEYKILLNNPVTINMDAKKYGIGAPKT